MKSLLSIFLSWVVLLVVYLKLLGKPKVTYVIFLRFYVFVCLFVCFWHVKGPRLQARGQIPAATASLQHSHSTPRSEIRLQPTPQLTAKTYEKYKVIIWVLLCFVSPFLFLLICEYPAVPASFVEDKLFSPFYQRSFDCTHMGRFLGSSFCSFDLRACFFIDTTPFGDWGFRVSLEAGWSSDLVLPPCCVGCSGSFIFPNKQLFDIQK